jgi:hypothetical protein
MYAGQLVFAQLIEHLPWHTFRRIVERYGGDRRVRDFSCASQFRCMAFAQLSYREVLRKLRVNAPVARFDLCLTRFPWAALRSTKAAIKLRTLIDLRGNIPSFIHISDGKLHDVNSFVVPRTR